MILGVLDHIPASVRAETLDRLAKLAARRCGCSSAQLARVSYEPGPARDGWRTAEIFLTSRGVRASLALLWYRYYV